MEPETQIGGPPFRPPPPSYPSAPPPYMDPQGGMYPMGQPGAMPYGVPPPAGAPPPYYAPPPNQVGYPTPGGYAMPPNQPLQGGYQGLYPDVSQLPQPQAGTVPNFPNNQHAGPASGAVPYPYCIPHSGYSPSAPPDLPPAYEEHIVSSGHTSLHAYATSRNSTQHTGSRHGIQHVDSKLPLGFTSPGAPQMPPGPCQTNSGELQMGSPSMPVRPAPCLPGLAPPNYSQGVPTSHVQEQAPWWATLKEGEAPPGCVISWKGGDGLKIYFIQEEGHIVSPNKSFQMAVYKRINGRGDVVEEALVGMIEILGSWRLRLHGKTSFTLHTYNDTYVFLDDSTCPSKSGRYVIIEMPADVSKRMRADLLALLQELTDLREEQEGVVGKITTNVETVYTDITKKINTVVKGNVPSAHKSTKWLRKGTGNLVRIGGNIVSKGMHFVADQMPANKTQNEEESPVHTELMEALIKFRKSKEDGTITFV